MIPLRHMLPVFDFQRKLEPYIVRAIQLAAPSPAKGEITYDWWTDLVRPVVCHLEYEVGQAQTLTDPGHPSTCTLTAAYVRDTDISDLLSVAQRVEIEELALISHESSSL